MNSVISPPDDLTDLFRSLDFETNTEAGDSYSLTLQRGDGIQVRHIPVILAFLSDRSAEDYHVWGFEEPENSLELANAIHEAGLFAGLGRSGNKQIFLTSHSPAFFGLTEPSVKRFFVSRSKEHGARRTSRIRLISSDADDTPGELMGETPHLPVISTYLRQAHEEIGRLVQQREKLAQELGERDKTIVFLEGDSDVLVLAAAWQSMVEEDPPFVFESAHGTSKMDSLAKNGSVLSLLAPGRKVFALVDNDEAGRTLYNNGHLRPGGRWVQHRGNDVWWCRLPFSEEFQKVFNDAGIAQAHWPGTLENLFSAELRIEAQAAGVYAVTASPHPELLDPQRYPLIQQYLTEDPERFYLLTPDPDYKIPFAEWIVATAASDAHVLEPLRPVVEGLREIVLNGPEENED